MRILIVGDSPENIGGVCNYTRPLHKSFSELGNEVHYLFSGGGYKKHYNFLFFPYLRSYNKNNNIFWHEIINSPNGVINFHKPLIDISSPSIERIFLKLITKIQPDVIHIHEMIGLSSKIISIAKEKGIKVFVTVHEYWWLCLHRVMIDYNKQICPGPIDIKKCSYCISDRYSNVKSDSKFKLALKGSLPRTFDLLLNLKTIFLNKNNQDNVAEKNLEIQNDDYNDFYKENLGFEEKLKNRLEKNLDNLNKCQNIIAVSNEVREILTKYGVNSDKIIVQHIGSEIASKKFNIPERKDISSINFGFIGGVIYYKGIHVLVEAYLKLKPEFIDKSEILIFGKYQETYKAAIDYNYGSKAGYKNIKFFGKYFSEEIKDIYTQIDIMVLPSICNDTAPQTIFESYAGGIPIIGPNIGGFPDFIEHDKNGLLFEPGDSEDLKEKMEYILENPGKIEDYRKNIPKLKTIEENAKELIELYKSI